MRLVLTTCPVDECQELIDKILKLKLAACVSKTDIDSRFWWKGKIGEQKEVLIIFKTRKELVDELFKKIKELHPYEVPLIGELEVKKVNEEYMEWLKEVTE